MSDLIPDEMRRLLVPLSNLPGFDPAGLPTEKYCCGAWSHGYGGQPECCGQPDEDVDLADAATRNRCARHLAGRVGLEVGLSLWALTDLATIRYMW